MFTGIVTDLGSVKSVIKTGDWRFELQTAFETASIEIGASICCSGVCLTVVETGSDWFAVDVSEETISKTTLGSWAPGLAVNLERSLKVGDEMGGHIVSGHIDGVGNLVSTAQEGDSWRMIFAAPSHLMRFIAVKGSIAVNGVSLTVNTLENDTFAVNIISHTQHATSLGKMKTGDPVNLEIDMLARYVARYIETEA